MSDQKNAVDLRRLALQAYIFLRRIAWASPLARSPFWAETFVRIGYTLRRRLGLSTRGDEVVMVHGSKIMFGAASECYVDMVSDAYELGVTSLFDTLIKPGMVIVDVGAHVGYYTLLAAQKVGPTGKVYAFEPDPSNYGILVKNIALNKYKNAFPVQKAVCNTEGTANFFLHIDTVAHSLHPVTQGRSKTTIAVETTSLDHFFEREGWPPVHLIKMDIEGAELAAISGMVKLLGRNRSAYLILEFVPQILRGAGIDPNELLHKLREMGFTIQVITEDGLQPLVEKAYENPNFRSDLFCERRES